MEKKNLSVSDYRPLKGFYDLRAFDIPAKEFLAFWRIQIYLHDVEQGRLAGKIHSQINEIRQLSANYQQELFRHKVTNPQLL